MGTLKHFKVTGMPFYSSNQLYWFLQQKLFLFTELYGDGSVEGNA